MGVHILALSVHSLKLVIFGGKKRNIIGDFFFPQPAMTFYFILFYFIFKHYNILLVLPNIEMNLIFKYTKHCFSFLKKCHFRNTQKTMNF